MNCLFLLLSLPVSHSGYLLQLMDLVIECINHQSNRVVMLSLLIIIKYYRIELSKKQIERLYNNLFSLITVTFSDDILILIAYLISLLPHYHYLIVVFFVLLNYRMKAGVTLPFCYLLEIQLFSNLLHF